MSLIGNLKLSSAGTVLNVPISSFSVNTNVKGKLTISFIVLFSEKIPVTLPNEKLVEDFLIAKTEISIFGAAFEFRPMHYDSVLFSGFFNPHVNWFEINGEKGFSFEPMCTGQAVIIQM